MDFFRLFLCHPRRDFLGALYHSRDSPRRRAKGSLQRAALTRAADGNPDSVHLVMIQPGRIRVMNK